MTTEIKKENFSSLWCFNSSIFSKLRARGLNKPVSDYAVSITDISKGIIVGQNTKLKDIYSSWARGNRFFSHIDGVICEIVPNAK